ncbi:MAG: DUF1360 domain-containing protein [Bacteroidetes bacterium]|nr:DUF1360 domain-containing protein [Bacteroidota bacterium]MBS1757139.1 DUF1360 domain-containing protein [Bacteroidota bacterium]
MAVNIFQFVIATFAVWRVTHLLSKEDGPFDIVYKIRKRIGQGFWGHLLDCFYCLSIWVSIPFGIWVGVSAIEKIICIIALSGAACVLQKITENKNGPPTFFEDKN